MESSLFVDVVEIRPNNVTRWLGVFFDRGVKFQHHIKKFCGRSLIIIRHIKTLSLITHGISLLLLRQSPQGAFFANLLYGAETWFSKNSSKDIIARVQLRINDAARAALPVYRTTPIPALVCETGWGPVRAWLDRINDRLTIRVASADLRHPLRRRWNSTRMNWIRQRITPELAGDTIPPPWSPSREESLRTIGAVGRVAGPRDFINWQATCPSLDLFVFSYGALIKDQAGAGVCIYRGLS